MVNRSPQTHNNIAQLSGCNGRYQIVAQSIMQK
jgi:hypothetical protein